MRGDYTEEEPVVPLVVRKALPFAMKRSRREEFRKSCREEAVSVDETRRLKAPRAPDRVCYRSIGDGAFPFLSFFDAGRIKTKFRAAEGRQRAD